MIIEFNQYRPPLLTRFRKKMKQTNFVTNQKLPELLDQSRRKEISKIKDYNIELIFGPRDEQHYQVIMVSPSIIDLERSVNQIIIKLSCNW